MLRRSQLPCCVVFLKDGSVCPFRPPLLGGKGVLALEVGLLGFSKSEAVPQRVKGVQAGVLHLDSTFKSPGVWGGLKIPMQGHTPDQDLQTHWGMATQCGGGEDYFNLPRAFQCGARVENQGLTSKAQVSGSDSWASPSSVPCKYSPARCRTFHFRKKKKMGSNSLSSQG